MGNEAATERRWPTDCRVRRLRRVGGGTATARKGDLQRTAARLSAAIRVGDARAVDHWQAQVRELERLGLSGAGLADGDAA